MAHARIAVRCVAEPHTTRDVNRAAVAGLFWLGEIYSISNPKTMDHVHIYHAFHALGGAGARSAEFSVTPAAPLLHCRKQSTHTTRLTKTLKTIR